MPFTTPAAGEWRAVGIGDFVVHVSVARSYASSVARYTPLQSAIPPTTYMIPFTTPTATWLRAVGIGCFVCHCLIEGSYASTTEYLIGQADVAPPTA